MGHKHDKKHKHHKNKNKDEDWNVNEEFMEQLAEGVFGELKKRRLLARKTDGEIAFEFNLAGSIIGGALLTIFLFPVIIGIVIWSYTNKVQFEVIRDITDEEATLIDDIDSQNTLIGAVDGEPTRLLPV